MSDSRREAKRARRLNREEGFLSLPSVPHFVARHLEDMGDGLLCPELPPSHETHDRKGNSSDYTDAANSADNDGHHPSSRDPRADLSQCDGSEAVPSIADGQWQERRMCSGGCRPHRMHRMRGHSCQVGQQEWDARSEWRDQRRPELAADRQRCHRRPCRWAVWLELELWPSCSSYPDLGPYEWSSGSPGATSPYMEHCPTCPRAHRF